MKRTLLLAVAATTATLANTQTTVRTETPLEQTVIQDLGLAALPRVYDVVTHHRCANCHVGADNIPMWSGPSYGNTRPHGMNIVAGESRDGATTTPCSTCHRKNKQFGSEPHAPPGAAHDWKPAPAQFAWFGICVWITGGLAKRQGVEVGHDL